MAIEGVGGPTAPRLGSRTAAASASGFSVAATSAQDRPSEVSATDSVGLASVLTLQEFTGETVQDREAKRHGQDMLAMLGALQRGLLGGGDGGDPLQRLAELAASVPRTTDRRLAAMVSAIIVRVRVELARRQV